MVLSDLKLSLIHESFELRQLCRKHGPFLDNLDSLQKRSTLGLGKACRIKGEGIIPFEISMVSYQGI